MKTLLQKTLKIIGISLISVNICLGDDVTYLPKDTPAPYTGYLFSIPKEKEIRLNNEKLQLQDLRVQSLEKINQSQAENLLIMEKRVEGYQKQSDELYKTIAEQNSNSFLANFGYFALGAVTTGFITWGVVRITK